MKKLKFKILISLINSAFKELAKNQSFDVSANYGKRRGTLTFYGSFEVVVNGNLRYFKQFEGPAEELPTHVHNVVSDVQQLTPKG